MLNTEDRSVKNKIGELSITTSNHNVDYACVTESWLNNDISDEPISIDGYQIARRDRTISKGGGGLCYIRNTSPYIIWNDHDEAFETLWIILRPPRMPCRFTHITISAINFPPRDEVGHMLAHIHNYMDHIRRKHPHTGIFIVGDLNHLSDSELKRSYSLKQIVTRATLTRYRTRSLRMCTNSTRIQLYQVQGRIQNCLTRGV